MSDAGDGELYHDGAIGLLEAVWGEGWLSPGGPDEVARVVDGLDLAGRSILDIGCGVGGIDFWLVEARGAGHVSALDVEDTVLAIGRKRAAARNLAERIGFLKAAPGPLPLPPAAFDVVFSKDAIVHVTDKHALAREVFRVLKPGGWFAASDWLIGHDGPPSPEMSAYIAAEGLDFGMASPGRYRLALEAAGFADIRIESRNAWYRETARHERARLSGPLYDGLVARHGRDFIDHNIEIWTRMIGVLDSGEHCPTHLRARKPPA